MAVGTDEDPLPKFSHLQEQRAEVQSDLSESSAQLSTGANGSFTIQESSAILPLPSGAAARGAVRMPRLSSKHYDPATGVMTFTWPGIGTLVVTPTDRQAPRSIFADGSVVSATGVSLNLSEVTLASNRYLEQHLVVDEQHAGVKLITWDYRLTLPDGVVASTTETGVMLMYRSVPLLSVNADVAVDEAGTRFPVDSSWDATSSTLTVSYDGRAHTPSGDVAIDPVFFPYGSDPQLFVMNVCQVPGTSAACEALPGTGLPPRFARFPNSHENYVTGRTSALGVYIQGKAGTTIPDEGAGLITYEALADTTVAGVALHATMDAPDSGFQCRAELLNKSASGVYSQVKASPWGWYGKDPNALNRVRVSTFDIDGDTISGFVSPGAEYAAMRLQNRSGAARAVQSGEPVRCSMKGEEAAAGAEQSDLFSVYLRDVHSPSLTHPLDPASNVSDQVRLVPGVNYDNGMYSTDTDLFAQSWYNRGDRVRYEVEASDKGSGVDRIQVSRPNTPFPNAAVPPSQTGATIDACASNTGTYESPCPTALDTWSAETILGDTLNQGLNTVWYRASDFSGNRTDSAPLHFLYDSVPPTAPPATFGTASEPTTPAADAELPTFDTKDVVILDWNQATDPGTDTAPKTGSGIASYTIRVEQRSAYGVWGPASAHPDVITPPVPAGADAPLSLDIAGREGIYRVLMTATDRAENTGPATVRYFRIDTTDPIVTLEAPVGEDNIELRAPATSGTISARVVDPSIGGADRLADATAALAIPGNTDPVDVVALQRRTGSNPSDWADITSVANQRWSTAFAPTSTPGLGNGMFELRVQARDGLRSNGSYFHVGATRAFKACLDTALHQRPEMRPTSVTAIPVTYPGSSFAGARIEFTVPGVATTQAYKWIVEALVNGEWTQVAAPIQQGFTTTYRVDDWAARPFASHYRVSAAAEPCSQRGDATIAREATTTGEPLLVEQPERVMPLLGLESRWSYWSIPAGGGTDAHVNTATGNVVVTRPLLSEPGVGLWTNVQLTYNSQQLGDDELLATNGIAGAHMTLAVGPGGSAADADTAASGVRVNDDAIVMRDADGTVRVFEPTLPVSNPNWNGLYRTTDGSRLILRNAHVQNGDDDHSDGVAGAVFKLTRPDGVTYYFARERSINGIANSEIGRLLAVRDREGHQLTYAYECVAVMPKDANVIRAYRVHQSNGAWAQVDESAEAQIVSACPANIHNVTGAHASASLRMRLVAVRDDRYAAGNGREVRLSYFAPDSDVAGHVRMIRGHDTDGHSRRVTFHYETAGAARTVQLKQLELIGPSGASRAVKFAYDPAMNDPGKWFDKNVIIKSVTDFTSNSTRFNYSVPDADAGFLYVNPRATRIENRKDVLRGDGRGVTLDYHLKPGFGADGLFAMRLSGSTTLRDQLDRSTRYNWNAADPFASDYGRTNSTVEPGGLTTNLEWNAHNEITQTRRVQAVVEREAVHIPGVGRSRVLTWPINAATARIENAAGANVTSSYSIDERGVIVATPAARTPDGHTVYVTYEPSTTRRIVETTTRDNSNGLPTNITGDKRWTHALGDRERGNYAGGSDLPQTSLTWTASSGPVVTRNLVRDLTTIVGPLAGAQRTDLDVDSATGRVLSVEAPGGSGTRSTQRLTYYPSGLLRSSTDALGWTIAYTNYTDDGQPTLISRRFCTAPPAGGVGSCGTPLAGWNPGASEAQVASIIPQAFRVTYTADAQVSCVRDVRGDDHSDHARFASYAYDDFGNVTAETSPWKRDGNNRVRRLSRHTYDANGNLTKTIADATYELGASFQPADCATIPQVRGGTTASKQHQQLPDTEYDELDRVVLTRARSNNHDGSTRVSRTRYDLVGNVVFQSEPNHEASSAGFDYTTTTKYDDRDRPVDVTDGERRHTCTYYDAWDNPVAVTPARWQRRTDCPEAPVLARSTFSTYDNAGAVVSTRAINGKVSFTLTDPAGNAIRSEETGAERTGRDAALQSDLRVTTRTFDAAGNVTATMLPTRLACTGAALKSCTPGSQTSVVPRITNSYDVLSRLIATSTARQNAESGLASTRHATYGYDADGRRITETLARAGEAARAARTTYDPFGNPIQVTLPNSADADAQGRYSTFFEYDDDNSLITKNDRAHDVLTTWGYDRRGFAVSRTEHGSGESTDEWDSTQQTEYYDDGSIERAPLAIAEFAAQRVYADGTCLRSPGSSQDNPVFVFQVLGDQQFSKSAGAPPFLSSSWEVGQVRRSGKIRLRKLRYSGGAHRTYDENGLPTTIDGCGTAIKITRRDGVGAPLTIENEDGGDVTYRYDAGGALLETNYPDGRSRTSRYVNPDTDPFTVDPGAGLEEVVAIDRPNLKKRYLQMSYTYTLDDTIDIEGRAATGIYKTDNGSITALTPTGYTTYEYDHVGVLAQTRALRTATAVDANNKPKSTKTGRAKPATPGKPATKPNAAAPDNNGKKIGLQGVEISQEDVIRDVAGNPRRVTTSLLRARIVPPSKAPRSQTRYYTYDVLDRISADDISALPAREYRYDAIGRLDRVLVDGLTMQDYIYNDTASRGAMLTRSITEGLTDPTRQLTVMQYGNGRKNDLGATLAGPRGQLVNTTRYDGKTTTTGLDHVTNYTYTHLNQQASAFEQSYEPLRERQSRTNRARKRTDRISSYMNYDLLGRRWSTNDYEDDLSDTTNPRRTATLSKYPGTAEDPYSEATNDPRQPGARWILRANGRIAGELRNQTPRYHVGNHQGSTLMTLAGNTAQTTIATFDYDTWGEPLTGEISLESGSKEALRHNIYGYTGMRTANAGDTTYHHARDYRADLKTWLQTDQYMDPWSDLALSLDPTTRDRHAYVNNNPVGYVDTNGHDPCPAGGSGCSFDPDSGKCYGRCGADGASTRDTRTGQIHASTVNTPPAGRDPVSVAVRIGVRNVTSAQLDAIRANASTCSDPSLVSTCADIVMQAGPCAAKSGAYSLLLGSNPCDGISKKEGAWNIFNAVTVPFAATARTTTTAATRGLPRLLGTGADDAVRAGQWGASVYKHGGHMTGIEHVFYRHAYNSGFKNVSRFNEGTSARQVKSYVDEALANGKVIGGSTVVDIGRPIGYDQAGNAVSGVRVYVRDGVIQTAFPVGM